MNKACVAIHAVQPNIYVCLNVKRFNVADWKFTFTHLNLSVGVTAPYSLIEICCWENGIPKAVHQDKYYECLMCEYIVPSTAPTYQECIDNKFSGLILSDKHVLLQWGQETDTIAQIWQERDEANGNIDNWDDAKYERKQRVEIAQKHTEHGHGILTAMQTPTDPALTDTAHQFWSWMGVFTFNHGCHF